jgi:hypothetical protein
MKVTDVFKNAKVFQPILTLVLVGLLLVMIFQFAGNDTSNSPNDPEYKEVYRAVTFDEAARKYLAGSFEVFTRGSVISRSGEIPLTQIKSEPNATTTPTTSVTPKPDAYENSYDDLFFYIDKNSVKRLDVKSYGQNASIFVNGKGEIMYLDNSARAYTMYPLPDDSETKVKLWYEAYKGAVQMFFPFTSLMKDYQDGKFNPVERATNVYSGKWKHDFFTSGDVVDVILQTEPETGLFRSFTVASSATPTPTTIYFDFKSYDAAATLTTVPEGYTAVELKVKYKVKA